MKIAHFPQSFFPTIGGAEIVVHNIAQEQALLGHEVYVIVPPNAIKYVKEKEITVNYKLIPLYNKSLNLILLAEQFKLNLNWIISCQVSALQKKYRFDIWHFNTIAHYAFASLKTLNKLNIPTVGTSHGGDIQIYHEVNYGLRRCPRFDSNLRKTIKKFSILTSISETVKDEYLKLGLTNKKTPIVPNGCNVDRIKKYKFNKEQTLKRLNIPTNRSIILTIGRNHPKKGFMNIVSIIKYLLKMRDDFIWVLVGKDNETIAESIKNEGLQDYFMLIPELGLDQNINMPSDETIEIYMLADILCFPTIVEAFPLVLLEAMAAGLPIATTNAPGARDSITNMKNGLISEVKDNVSMAKNINLILKDSEIRKQLISNGLIFIKDYEWVSVSRSYVNVYSQISE